MAHHDQLPYATPPTSHVQLQLNSQSPAPRLYGDLQVHELQKTTFTPSQLQSTINVETASISTTPTCTATTMLQYNTRSITVSTCRNNTLKSKLCMHYYR